MFFHRGGEDEKETFSPIPNDEWHFRFINENAAPVVDQVER